MQAKNQTDFFTGLIIVLFCLVMWLAVFPGQIPKGNDSVFPHMVTTWIFINGLLLLIKNWGYRKAAEDKRDSEPVSLTTILLINVLYLITIIAISFFGFHGPVFCFLVAAMHVSGEKSWIKAIIIALVVVVAIHLMIETVFNYALP